MTAFKKIQSYVLIPPQKEAEFLSEFYRNDKAGTDNHSGKKGYMKKLIAAAGVTILLGLSANVYSQSPAGQNMSTKDYSSGEALYESRCQFCHGVKGDGNGPGSSVLVPRPSDFTDPDFWKYRNNENIARTLMSGHGKGMPAFRFLPEDIKAAIDYISHFKKPGAK